MIRTIFYLKYPKYRVGIKASVYQNLYFVVVVFLNIFRFKCANIKTVNSHRILLSIFEMPPPENL